MSGIVCFRLGHFLYELSRTFKDTSPQALTLVRLQYLAHSTGAVSRIRVSKAIGFSVQISYLDILFFFCLQLLPLGLYLTMVRKYLSNLILLKIITPFYLSQPL